MSKPTFIFVYVVFIACLLEGTARLTLLIPPLAHRLQANEDYTYRRSWVKRHRQTKIDALYTFDVYDALAGWRTKPNVKDLKVFGNKTLNTNSNGLRGKTNFSYTKNKDTVRILILGDSFTFGDDVSDDETYSYYLQQMLPRAEVINMGVHGYGHDQMLILFKEEGVKYQPDIVILGFLPLDMSRNLLEFRDFAKPRFVLEAGRLKLTGTPVPRPEDILRGDWVRPRILDIFSLITHKFKKVSGFQQKEMKAITTAILTDMIKSIESIHAIPILAYLPRGKEIAMPVTKTLDEAYMLSICRSNEKARCVSTRPYFSEKIAQGRSFKSRGHWDRAGHMVVAEAIQRYLLNQGYVAVP